MQCWAFPDPEREDFDQVVVMGYRKEDPVPDAHAEGMVMEWSVGQPETLRSRRDPYSYGEYTPATTPTRATCCSPPAPSIRSPLRPRPGGRGCG